MPWSSATCWATSAPPGICTAHVCVKCPRAPGASSNSSPLTLDTNSLQIRWIRTMRHTLIKRRRFNDDECDDDVWLWVLISSSESSEHVLLTKLISRVNLLRRWRWMVGTKCAPHRSPLQARRTRLVGALSRWMGRSVYESWPPLLHHWFPSSDIFCARVRRLSFSLYWDDSQISGTSRMSWLDIGRNRLEGQTKWWRFNGTDGRM